MSVYGLLQFSPELGICSSQTRGGQFKYRASGNLHSRATNALSFSSLDMLWNLQLPSSTKRARHFLPYRYSTVTCRCSISPIQKVVSSCIRGTETLTRSCNALQGNPSAIKFISAVGIIAFALWGLDPLVRSSSNASLRKSDSSWRKSTTNYLLASYLQPICLWIGTMLVCRGVDPIVMPSEASNLIKQRVLTFVRSLSTVMAFAYSLSCAVEQARNHFVKTNDQRDVRNIGFQFAGKAVYSAVWVAALSLFMELLGFSAQKWLTAGGLGTVLITLAGREILTNFLSGVMIHATRPFVENEWIRAKIEGYEVSGTVERIGWWSPTIVRGEDREALHIPNHKFTVNVVRNLTQKTHWRMKTHLGISHLDVNKINNIVADMRKVVSKNPHVEQQRLHRRVFLESVNPENQALMILVSCFVKTSHYEEFLCVQESIMLDLLRVISHHGARLATPLRTFQKVYREADVESSPTSGFGSEAATRRPLLLVEPAYKISGEEKVKSPSRSKSEEKDSHAAEQQPASDLKPDVDVKEAVPVAFKAKETSKSDVKVETPNPWEDEKRTSTNMPKVVDVTQTAISSTSTGTVSEKADKVAGPDVNLPIISKQELLKKDAKRSGNLAPSVLSSESSNQTSSGPSSSSSHSKQVEKPPVAEPKESRSGLEENIVLGVALDGSKRTLPIDDDCPQADIDSGEREEAVVKSKNGGGSGNRNGNQVAERDDKELK